MHKDILVKLRQQLDAALAAETPEAYDNLTKGLMEVLGQLNQAQPQASASAELEGALMALEACWYQGAAPPARLPGRPEDQARLTRLLDDVLAAQGFALSMSKGDLTPTLPAKGLMAGGLKALQANLRHLTWQTQMIAQGDFGQRVDFMGEFSESFNSMVRSLAAGRDQLLAANQELEAFSYSVSHDLRAPLRAIAGFSQILSEDHAQRLDDEGLRLLQVIIRSTRLMGKLIDDLLAFSRLDRQEVQKSDIDMTGLTRGLARELQDRTPEQSFQLTVKELPPARGDQALINQVLVNLLANAVKFTAPMETGVIEVGGFSESHENIYYVRDNGVGFDMQQAAKLFGVFQRLHGVAEFEGTGVGLAIVQKIIQRHGGRVWAEGTVNEGATFYFALPKSAE